MSKIVKNISTKELSIPNVGTVKVGEQVTVPDSFSNPNFQVVSTGKGSDESETKTDTKAVASDAKGDKKTTTGK